MNPDKVRCPGCARDFTLPSNLLVGKTLRLRCPACGHAFRLRVAKPAPAAQVEQEDAAARATGQGQYWPPRESTIRDAQEDAAALEQSDGLDPAPSADATRGEAAEDACAPADDAVLGQAREDAAAVPEPEKEREEDSEILRRRARRLSRALVLEMMQGQRSRRDRALAEGSLLLEFGEDLRRIWELYIEKVGSETAHDTTYFRKALNEILADGKQLF